MNVNRKNPNLGPRISIATHEGVLLARLASPPSAGNKPGQFLSPHGLALESKGNLYVGEVGTWAWPSLFPDEPIPADLHRMHRLTKVAAV